MPKRPDARLAAAAAGPARRTASAPAPAGRPRGAKPSLAAIVAAAAPAPVRILPKTRAAIPEIVTPEPPQAPRRGGGTLTERARQMSVYLEPAVYDQLRDLAHAERTKMHVLMLEALDGLFRQRGARSIAQLTEADEA